MSTDASTTDDDRTDREVLREMALSDELKAQPVYHEMYVRRYGVVPEEDA